MINNVVLVGRMTRDAELRYTPSNVAVATFSLAVNRNFKGANGERETDFINCVIWRQQAENLANWAKKGALIGITGRIQTRNYENQCSTSVRNVDITLPPPFSSSSKLVKAAHQFLPSSVFTACTFSFPSPPGASTASIS